MKLDRLPRPAPFPVGTKLRYIGTTEVWTFDIKPDRSQTRVELCVPGLEVVIGEVRPGRRGTFVHLTDEDGPMYWDDTGEPILDETKDSYCVYYVAARQNGLQQGRCIDNENAHEWEIVK